MHGRAVCQLPQEIVAPNPISAPRVYTFETHSDSLMELRNYMYSFLDVERLK